MSDQKPIYAGERVLMVRHKTGAWSEAPGQKPSAYLRTKGYEYRWFYAGEEA